MMFGTLMSMYYVVWFCMKYIMCGMHNVQIASDCDTVTFIRRTTVNVQRTRTYDIYKRIHLDVVQYTCHNVRHDVHNIQCTSCNIRHRSVYERNTMYVIQCTCYVFAMRIIQTLYVIRVRHTLYSIVYTSYRVLIQYTS